MCRHTELHSHILIGSEIPFFIIDFRFHWQGFRSRIQHLRKARNSSREDFFWQRFCGELESLSLCDKGGFIFWSGDLNAHFARIHDHENTGL